VVTDAQRWRVGAFESKTGQLFLVLNGDEVPRKFRVRWPTGETDVALPPFGYRLIARNR
jgi:hypothetical protein